MSEHTDKRHPIRTCIGCRTKKAPDEMLRVVASKDGGLVIDAKGILPGRGMYICRSLPCIEKAYRSRSFNRAARRSISPSQIEEIYGLLKTEVERD